MATVNIHTRAVWDARAPRGSYTRVMSTRGTKVHYTGGYVSPAILGDHDGCLDLMKQIQNHHMDNNGWMDFAYSLAGCVHGEVLMGRGPHRLVAANGKGLNTQHYAIIGLIGNKGLTEPTPELLHALRDGIDYLRAVGGAGKEIKGHRDGYATDCPGGPLYRWVKAGAPRPGSAPADLDAWPGRLLRYPPITHGEDVRRWQAAAVIKHGQELLVDGAYGPASQRACREIQHAAGLDEDGIVGPDTWRATFRA
jgi:peptidoglycan hydrolase-like protein with peptidoglycan-binding domain